MATIAPRDPIAHHRRQPEPEEALAALNGVRGRTLALVDHLNDAQLCSVLSPIMSPLVWDLAHIAAYEDLWLAHRHGGLDLLRPDLAELYDAFETPRSVRGEVELLDAPQARAYLSEVRERSTLALSRDGVGDGTLYELVLRHELQHSETMRQTMALAGLLPAGEPLLGPLTGENAWIEVPAGPFAMGASPDGFAYDNERPRHTVELAAFQIALHPVTSDAWRKFGDEGGYERRALWSPEGWAWMREREGVRDGRAYTLDPATPICHVNWFEAEAYANSVGARLPIEAEWEKAASLGALAAVGEVWEWTASRFDGYPGFVAHPYREYSEVFFGEDYRVLRGGSWASDPRVATLTFRNWDLPIRDQIFAGLRLARDVS
jgi:iron(II)-dependent oxidoreductase